MASPPAPSYSASSEAKSSSSSFSSPAPALINDPSNELQDEISYLPQHNHHESFTSPPLDNAHDTRCDPDEKAHDDDREERGSQAAASDEASLLSRSAERRFKLKLDMMLLTWAWLAYLTKKIDFTNYKAAFASGMKEDLSLYGNELNYLETYYRIGYALFTIPSQIIMLRVRPSIWLPLLELVWGVLTACMAACTSVRPMYAIRFFIGVAEASAHPGVISVLCAWYTPSEIAARISIFTTSFPAGSIFVGFMQAALHTNMDGDLGLAGWQWLFIFNAIMTIIIAIPGFWIVPDDPSNSKAFYLTETDLEIARDRVKRTRKVEPSKLTWSLAKSIFSRSTVYFSAVTYAFWNFSQNANSWMLLFLKHEGFSVVKLNTIPIGGYVLQIIAMLFLGWWSDRTKWRARLIVLAEVTCFFGCIVLAIYPKSFGLKMVGYFSLFLSDGAGPIIVAWMSDLEPSPEGRALALGTQTTLTFAIDAFANPLIYPASEAPNYRIGYKAASVFCVCTMLMAGFWRWWDPRTRAERKAQL